MKRSFRLFFLGLLLLSLPATFETGCNKTTLAPGGAYAPAGAQPDEAFFVVDAAYQLAYNALDAAFTFERNNRIYLYKLSPEIKRTLDSIRPDATKYNAQYLAARDVYKANPVPSGLSDLRSILAKIQQITTTATSVLPK